MQLRMHATKEHGHARFPMQFLRNPEDMCFQSAHYQHLLPSAARKDAATS